MPGRRLVVVDPAGNVNEHAAGRAVEHAAEKDGRLLLPKASCVIAAIFVGVEIVIEDVAVEDDELAAGAGRGGEVVGAEGGGEVDGDGGPRSLVPPQHVVPGLQDRQRPLVQLAVAAVE